MSHCPHRYFFTVLKAARECHRPLFLPLLLIFCMLNLCQCAGGLQGIFSTLGTTFKANTRKEFTDYNLEEKREYRRYKLYQKEIIEQKDREILRRMKTGATTI